MEITGFESNNRKFLSRAVLLYLLSSSWKKNTGDIRGIMFTLSFLIFISVAVVFSAFETNSIHDPGELDRPERAPLFWSSKPSPPPPTKEPPKAEEPKTRIVANGVEKSKAEEANQLNDEAETKNTPSAVKNEVLITTKIKTASPANILTSEAEKELNGSEHAVGNVSGLHSYTLNVYVGGSHIHNRESETIH